MPDTTIEELGRMAQKKTCVNGPLDALRRSLEPAAKRQTPSRNSARLAKRRRAVSPVGRCGGTARWNWNSGSATLFATACAPLADVAGHLRAGLFGLAVRIGRIGGAGKWVQAREARDRAEGPSQPPAFSVVPAPQGGVGLEPALAVLDRAPHPVDRLVSAFCVFVSSPPLGLNAGIRTCEPGCSWPVP